jgi:Sec-independent protein secretion pathway component TatC
MLAIELLFQVPAALLTLTRAGVSTLRQLRAAGPMVATAAAAGR